MKAPAAAQNNSRATAKETFFPLGTTSRPTAHLPRGQRNCRRPIVALPPVPASQHLAMLPTRQPSNRRTPALLATAGLAASLLDAVYAKDFN